MKKTFLILAICFVFYSLASAKDVVKSGCVTCHTSEKILKDLVKPPNIEVGEGEG